MTVRITAGTGQHSARQRTWRLSVAHFLERAGLKIVPYYVMRESLSDLGQADVEPGLNPLVGGFLSDAEVESLFAGPELIGLRDEMHRWKDKDCLCFGLKHNGEIVAHMWCNLNRCNIDLISFPLQPEEAFLFRVRTLKAYRGQNLAPFLSYQLYKALVDIKRTRYFSVIEYFNTPAVNFKKKLKARPLRLGLYIGLCGKIKWNFKLKEYGRWQPSDNPAVPGI
jgi:hypothetical protein